MKRGFIKTCLDILALALIMSHVAPAEAAFDSRNELYTPSFPSWCAMAAPPTAVRLDLAVGDNSGASATLSKTTYDVDVKAMDVASAGPGASVKELMASINEEWSRVWGWKPSRPTTVYLYFGGESFANGVSEIVGESISPEDREYLAKYVSGMALNRDALTGGYAVAMNLGHRWGSPAWEAETRTVLVHEYTHVMLADAAGGAGPIWFNEGMAELMAYVRVQNSPYLRSRTYFAAQANNQGWLPALTQLQSNWGGIVTSDQRSAQVAYGASYFAVKFLADRVGGMPLLQVLQRVAAGEEFNSALPAVTGYTVERLDAEYRATIPRD